MKGISRVDGKGAPERSIVIPREDLKSISSGS